MSMNYFTEDNLLSNESLTSLITTDDCANFIKFEKTKLCNLQVQFDQIIQCESLESILIDAYNVDECRIYFDEYSTTSNMAISKMIIHH